MRRLEALRWLQVRMESFGIPPEEAQAEARYALATVLDCSVGQLYLEGQREVSAAEEARLLEILRRREQKEPLAYILGERSFMGLSFFVRPGVLIPRQETELLVEQALSKMRMEGLQRVLDLCTGSGCIAVSLAKLGGAEVCASDISPEALEVAAINAQRQQVEVRFVKSDLFENLPERYDLITANPPYITRAAYAGLSPEVRDYEPRLALLGGEDGLDLYRRITREAPRHLRAGGYLAQEIGYDQAEAVAGLLHAQGFSQVQLERDYAGLDRIVWARWPGDGSENTDV